MFTFPSPRAAVRRALSEPLIRVALAGSALVVAGGVLATAVLPEASATARFLHLDREHGLAAHWSALLMISAGIAAITLRGVSRWLAAFGGGLVLLALDEVLVVHEALEQATGIDWQVLYSPLALAAAVVGVAVLRVLRALSPQALLLFAAGCASWFTSQVLEAVQWNGDVRVTGYVPLMLTEEALEMGGSICVLAAVLVLRAHARSVQHTRTIVLPDTAAAGRPEAERPTRAA